jgi:phytoene synthase
MTTALPPRSAEGDSALAERVRAEDRDRYFASLFAPHGVRTALLALHELELTLSEIVRTTTEPQIGLIRLAWWRDALAGLAEKPVPGQPLLELLGARPELDFAALADLAERFMDLVDGGANAGDVGARFFLLAGSVIAPSAGCDGPLAEAGRYWAASREIRAGVATGGAPPAERLPAALRPLTALAAAGRRDYAGRREARGSFGRQLAMLRHMATGRI